MIAVGAGLLARAPPSLGEASVVTGQAHGYFFGVWKK
ncbi:hypothetical protein CF149_20111 [Pseudomonas psychrophila]|nr:hypothetical protein CF149_20111 [Pseudomonas psychrophila]